jgi:hypothetical protein
VHIGPRISAKDRGNAGFTVKPTTGNGGDALISSLENA